MPTRNVVLTKHHERLITDLVASGQYQYASEILRAGLRLVGERDANEAAKLEDFRAAALAGLEAMESGAYRDFGSFDELGAYLNATTNQAIACTTASQPMPSENWCSATSGTWPAAIR